MKIYIVAGEPSGDLLGAELMSALRRTNPSVEFRGVGGESMAEQGLASRFDIEEISVMGIFEVLPRLRRILRRIRETADDIVRWQPDVLVTVDSWGFVGKLVQKLRKEGIAFPVVHYVAPQVWAWKNGRAPKVAKLIDRLMTLMPDEGKYFEQYGLQCDFVGHPVVERMRAAACDTADFRAELGIAADRKVLCVLPGSRRSEVKRLLPIFQTTLEEIRRRAGDFEVVIPTVPGVAKRIERFFAQTQTPVHLVTGRENRYKAFCISTIALAKSGTVSLELAAAGVPHLIAYRFNALSNLAAKLLVKIRFANLLNLLADKEIIPEFVLDNCRADRIAPCAVELLTHSDVARKQAAAAKEQLDRLHLPDMLPSDRAAQVVLEAAAGK